MRISTLLLLQLIVVCTYARSFSSVDIPDPPQFVKDDRSNIHIEKQMRDETTMAPLDSTTQPPETEHPTTSNAPTQDPVTTPSPTQQPTTTRKTTTPSPTQPPTTTIKTTTPSPTQPPTTTKKTTTLDPWDEFCQEACEEGLAGPECDCPEHPIGRRSVRDPMDELSISKPRHRRSIFDTSKAKPTVNLKVKRLIMEYCKVICTNGIDNDLCKCKGFEVKPGSFGKDPGFGINGSIVDTGTNTTQVPGGVAPATTTRDPLEVFCETACADGQGTLACNCHDHIVGRRRRSVKTLMGYPAKRSSGQYRDITHRENTLPHSVQQQNLSVQFPFRTTSKINKAHEDKLT